MSQGSKPVSTGTLAGIRIRTALLGVLVVVASLVQYRSAERRRTMAEVAAESAIIRNLADQGRLPEAIERGEALIAKVPEDPFASALVLDLILSKGDGVRAESLARGLLDHDRKLHGIRFRLALALIQQEKNPAAEAELAAVLAAAPDLAAAGCELGKLYERTARPEEAKKAYQAVLARHAGYADAEAGIRRLALRP